MALPISYGASKAARLASAQEFLPSGFGASTAAVSGRSSAASSTAKYYNQLSEQISKITARNNAWSAAQAAQQMAFQRESAQAAMRLIVKRRKKIEIGSSTCQILLISVK